jgi:hypothetical protein
MEKSTMEREHFGAIGKGSTPRLSVHVQAYARLAVRGVEKISTAHAGVRNLNYHFEPLSRPGPLDIELVLQWLNHVILRVVDLVAEFGVRDVDVLVHAELVQKLS